MVMQLTKTKKLFCPVCNMKMRKEFEDPHTYQEMAENGEIIDVRHVIYRCTKEKCKTGVRLRFRLDGKVGDLFRIMAERRKAQSRPGARLIVEDIPGKMEGFQGTGG